MLKVRVAAPGEGKAIEAFLEATNEDTDVNESFVGIAKAIDRPRPPNFYIMIALDEETIVGALLAGPPAAWIGTVRKDLTKSAADALTVCITEISWLVVKPEYRRSGIGTALISLVESEIKKLNNIVVLFFDHNKKHLQRFYERNNYAVVPYGHGICVQPPAPVRPIGIRPTYQAAYKMLKPRMHAVVLGDQHIIHGVFDQRR